MTTWPLWLKFHARLVFGQKYICVERLPGESDQQPGILLTLVHSTAFHICNTYSTSLIFHSSDRKSSLKFYSSSEPAVNPGIFTGFQSVHFVGLSHGGPRASVASCACLKCYNVTVVFLQLRQSLTTIGILVHCGHHDNPGSCCYPGQEREPILFRVFHWQ